MDFRIILDIIKTEASKKTKGAKYMNNVLSSNLKKLRLQKNLTQEQIAEALGISAQTISRWECDTTLPDVMILPEIARLYCVTIDDLYKENTTAYDNLFQRLASIYEETKQPEDFICADTEYKKLMKAVEVSLEDMRIYAIINQRMMVYCKDKAYGLYNKILEKGKNSPDNTYWLTKYAKANLSVLTGDADEFINEQKKTVAENPDDANELCVLMRALYYAKRYKEGYDLFTAAKQKFSGIGHIYAIGGDICRKLGKYQEAFECWDKAICLDNGMWLDGKYSKAFCYEELGKYEEAYNMWLEIIKKFREDGYEIEAEAEEKRAQRCLEKINKS